MTNPEHPDYLACRDCQRILYNFGTYYEIKTVAILVPKTCSGCKQTKYVEMIRVR